ncbi:MAG: tRNA pseudouridine synthase A, partial [Spirochaetes bacterium]|nr:tRNA pseudouridine synthase A [Spirochaetota bacterium]
MNEDRNILLVVSYNGAGFAGWQRLPGRERTVQETLEKCLTSLLGEDINVIGAGRTDAGVHAEGQAVNFRTKSDQSLDELGTRIKAALPADIGCSAIREAVPNFHARYRALGKTYAYRLHDGPVADPHPGKKAWHVSSPLDEKAMQQAGELFTGIRNFYAFTGAKTDSRNFLRELTEVRLERKKHLLDLYFSADGFLNRQVRIMAA